MKIDLLPTESWENIPEILVVPVVGIANGKEDGTFHGKKVIAIERLNDRFCAIMTVKGGIVECSSR